MPGRRRLTDSVTEIFGIPVAVILGQLMLGLVNGSFYAMLSLGLAVIFGLMGVVNFAHGAFYALGAFAALLGLQWLGINYWAALLLAPLAIGLPRRRGRAAVSAPPVQARPAVRPAADLRTGAGHRGHAAPAVRCLRASRYPVPARARGRVQSRLHDPADLSRLGDRGVGRGLLFGTWFVIERTRLGATLRAATENAPLLQAFGVNVPLLVAATYGGGVALAALAGVLSAPVILVSPQMGNSLVIVVFAVVVIGGMGSILGADRQRPGARCDRGLHQGHLSGGLEHRRVRDHGAGADRAARRTVREGIVGARHHRVLSIGWPCSRSARRCWASIRCS